MDVNMVWPSYWHMTAARALERGAPERYLAQAAAGSLEQLIDLAVKAALDRYMGMVEDGADPFAAREICMSEMLEEVTGDA